MNKMSFDEKIESSAMDLLRSYFDKKECQMSAPIDPIDIIEYLGYSVEYVNGKYDSNVYGAFVPETNTVEVNDDISFTEGMENFTLAHEIGHIILHLNESSKHVNAACNISKSNNSDIKEMEADRFASFLLMPTQMMQIAFHQLRRKPLHLKKNFILSYLLKKSKRKRALEFAGEMIQAGNFTNVSKLAMVNRMIGMGLLRGIPYQKNIQKIN